MVKHEKAIIYLSILLLSNSSFADMIKICPNPEAVVEASRNIGTTPTDFIDPSLGGMILFCNNDSSGRVATFSSVSIIRNRRELACNYTNGYVLRSLGYWTDKGSGWSGTFLDKFCGNTGGEANRIRCTFSGLGLPNFNFILYPGA